MHQSPLITAIVFHNSDRSLLERTLWSLKQQIFRRYEVVVLCAEGSKEVAETAIHNGNDQGLISYVTVNNTDYNLSDLFNRTIKELKTDYIFTTRSGCILKEDVLQCHFERRRKNAYLSGGEIEISQDAYRKINECDIATQRSFKTKWLYEGGVKKPFLGFKLSPHFIVAQFMEWFIPRVPVWNIENGSGWTKDIIAVNGLDTRYELTGFDKDLGVRLANNGVVPVRIDFSAVLLKAAAGRVIELDYESSERNRVLLEESTQLRARATAYGIAATP